VGLSRLSKAAHALEDEVEALRAGDQDRPPPDLTEVLASLRQLARVDNHTADAKRLLKRALRALEAVRGPSTRTRRPTLTTLPVPRSAPDELAVTVERRGRPERRDGERRGEDERMIRVNAERLDALLNAVGEIVFRRTLIERRSDELTGLVRDLGASHQSLRASVVALRDLRGAEQYVQRFSELEIEFSDVLSNFDRAEAGLKEETEGLRKDAQYLQEGLTQIRLLSVRYLFARLRRSVRDIARSEGKQVVLQVQGEHTEIDKVVAEKIADPMIQIIRNAVAHGVESPEARRAAGKPEAGTVTITAVQENNFVTLEVSDDGCGIDLESIREALAAKGLMSADEARVAPEAEVTAAIFLPGLSTRHTADAVAGRGVGLDVVRDTISKLGGEVTVQSERGRGTRFVVRMPLSTAVTNALLFKCGGEVFCIPIRWVAETRTVKASDVVIHRGRDAVVHRDKTIPLLRLAELLGTEARLLGKYLPTIVLRHLDFEFALVVDKLIGPREIVLRELGPLLAPLDLYAAATISGAGKAQLVLDVPTLHVWASAWRTLPRAARRAALPLTSQTRILVCDDSRSIREVVSRILQAEGYGVELANDGWDAWERMTGLRVDLLLTDLEMPRMDGYTLIEKVRKEDEFQGLPILVLSSRTGEDNQRRARRAGADGFLFKPVNRRVIIARVQELLRN
jgi:chemosensory pili system protein ChpA (sensor histidine kinase/response regulator)